jgi:hypothetical protein
MQPAAKPASLHYQEQQRKVAGEARASDVSAEVFAARRPGLRGVAGWC